MGDLVLKANPKNAQSTNVIKGKFEPNWVGPFIVTAAYGSGAYQLTTPEGEPLFDPVNRMHLHKYWA